MQINTQVASILVLVGLSASINAWASQKFDARLAGLMAQPPHTAAAHISVDTKTRAAYVETLLRYQGDSLEGVVAAGGRVRSVLGNIASVDIPVASLAAIAELPEVVYVELARHQVQRLNVSVPATRATLLRGGTAPNFTGVTGKNVIVGIVDDGLAFRHLDFRKPDGGTRLLELWDQRTTGAAGVPPPNYAYGGICTIAMLNGAIGGDASACTQPSVGNHGTHVGGIAVGNGQQTGNGRPAYRFIGMAPEADILSSNSIATGVPASAVVDAVAWMKSRAQAVGKPLVVNLSLGSYFGARDGTSNYETALSNASGPGVVLVGAAGNESGDAIRAIGTISQGETKSVTLNWASTVTKNQVVEMWYPGTNQYAIKVTGPGAECGTVTFVAAGATQSFNPACGTIEVSSTAPQVNNDDRQIVLGFTINPVNATGFHGAWTIEIQGVAVNAPNTPFSMICADDGNGLLFTSNTEPVTKSILTDTASATRVIAVASYNTNYNWLTTGGVANIPANHGPLGDVSVFSSRGPRRDCSNLAKCPKVMKPDITAPGAMIMAALGDDAKPVTGDTKEEDGRHVAYNGTSMATPHVAGAIALMLQKNPNLTPEDVRRLLAQNRQTNAFTINLPTFNLASPLMPDTQNDHWGYGILDAKAAYDATTGVAPPPVVPLTPLSTRGGIDLDGNNRGAIVLRSAGSQMLAGRLVNNQFQFTPLADPGASFRVVGIGDFDGNGKSDLAFQNITQGEFGDVKIWKDFSSANEVFWRQVKQVWDVQAVGNLDGDSFGDLVWRYVATDPRDTGVSYVWFTNGNAVTQVRKRGGAPLNWTLLGAMDINGDGAADMIYISPDGLVRALMAMPNRTCANFLINNMTPGFAALKLADFTGNRRGDMLLHNPSTGNISMFSLNASGLPLPPPSTDPDNPNASCTGTTTSVVVTVFGFPQIDPAWRFFASGDFNGDGTADVVWVRPNGTLTVWLMNPNGATPTVIDNAGTAPGGYVVIQP